MIYTQTSTSDEDFDKGVQLYESARFAEAADAFKRSIKRNQTNPEAHYYLANSYFRMYRDRDAVKAYQRAVELNPNKFLVYNNLGTAYHRLGDFKQALNSYETALQIKPDYPEAVFGLGVVYLELKDKEAALQQHQRLAVIDIKRADKLYDYINNKISLSVLNGKALNLPKPPYPAQARDARASGVVAVWVSIDETGKVISASAVSGHVILRPVAVEAAKLARFTPTMLDGQPIKVTGIITYNFVPEEIRPATSPLR
ncbi:MAG TPA: TonB family protein [Pyrinomonadaceae bacterium]|nr:TonB family protein [Pyrinomonadaceae bacterium]